MYRKLVALTIIGLLFTPPLFAEIEQPLLESRGYATLPKTNEILEYLKRVTQGNPKTRLLNLGQSAGGLPYTAILISTDPVFLQSGKSNPARSTLLLVGSQHGTEASGCEALQLLIKNLLSHPNKPYNRYLNHFNFVIVANGNPDGRDHYCRANQNGVNLSTDFIELSQPETVHISRLLKQYQPDALIDLHEFAAHKKRSLGPEGYLVDFNTQIETANAANLDEALKQYMSHSFLPKMIKRASQIGLSPTHYIGEITTVKQPITHGGLSLRNLRNYAGAHGILSILVENKIDVPFKKYPTKGNMKDRIRRQLLSLHAFLDVVMHEKKKIKTLIENARSKAKERTCIALSSRYVQSVRDPFVSIPLIEIKTHRVIQYRFKNYKKAEYSNWVPLPSHWVVIDHQEEIKSLLDHHHIQYEVLKGERSGWAHFMFIQNLEYDETQQRGQRLKVELLEKSGHRIFKKGDLWVDVHQLLGPLIVEIFDPRSTSSLFQTVDFYKWLKKDLEHPFFIVPVDSGVPKTCRH